MSKTRAAQWASGVVSCAEAGVAGTGEAPGEAVSCVQQGALSAALLQWSATQQAIIAMSSPWLAMIDNGNAGSTSTASARMATNRLAKKRDTSVECAGNGQGLSTAAATRPC